MQSTEQAIKAFSQQLGLSDTEEEEFGWIAEIGLQSPLPVRWISHNDVNSGLVYYVDQHRQVSSWENPLIPFLRQVVEVGRQYLQQPQDGYFENQKGILWRQHKHELDYWHGPFSDDDGRQYFVNSSDGVASWQDPRVDAQYIFELQRGLLSSLEEVLPPPPMDPSCDEQGLQPRQTASGAEVLTLDSSPRLATSFNSRPRTGTRSAKQVAMQSAKEEHRSALESMGAAAERLLYIQLDEAEIQRLQFNKKLEARRRRRRASASAAPDSLPPAAQAAQGAAMAYPCRLASVPLDLGAAETGVVNEVQPPAVQSMPPGPHVLKGPWLHHVLPVKAVSGSSMDLSAQLPESFQPPALPPSPMA